MLDRGSDWWRWEPHIHTPGTVLNDQFGGPEAWNEWLDRIESITPPIRALGITDYYLTETYRKVLQFKEAGRLPNVDLIFPNVELRLNAAARSGFVNIHLLVCPAKEDHLEELERLLKTLTLDAYDDCFCCDPSGLIRLGRAADQSVVSERAALQNGATQFKVDFSQLRAAIGKSAWARENVRVAVAGGSGDGTSGLRQAADATTRKEIETFADIIFSGSPSQREFWLGRKSLSIEVLYERYRGPKPCLHGSDAHVPDRIGQPDKDRYCWVKGAIDFDSLRQACIDPGSRAYVGIEPPHAATPSQVISGVLINNANWVDTRELALNSGLVAIIGARGSGKTALADIIAVGCDAVDFESSIGQMGNSASFISRAREHLHEETVTLTWAGGAEITRRLDGRDANGATSFPRAKYLSQQFVEELCSAAGASESLVREIERIIFESHSQDEREGAVDFEDLRRIRTERFCKARHREAEAISDMSDRVASEIEKKGSIEGLEAKIKELRRRKDSYEKDLKRLVIRGSKKEAEQHAEIARAAQSVRSKVQALHRQRRSLEQLQDEVASMRETKAPELLRQAQERHTQSGMSEDQWADFMLVYQGDVDGSLSRYIALADKQIEALRGVDVVSNDQKTPIFGADEVIEELPLKTLEAEMTRLEARLSEDKIVRQQYAALSQRIANERSSIESVSTKLEDARGAAQRQTTLQEERMTAYVRLFQAVVDEQNTLADLYAPLMNRLGESQGTISKLGFSVRRVVDIDGWADAAEQDLLDLRRAGPLQGRGALTAEVRRILEPVWQEGSPEEIKAAMALFVSRHFENILAHRKVSDEETEDRAWLTKFAHWFFDTSHISIRYEILYEDTDIRKLSPGTRGIVLLLLYLALDDADDRPLIIDQPEENLDPKSVFDELVSLFVGAKSKRQVILVTHNANLVVNTDADQIIVAESTARPGHGLPTINYASGGLEGASTRQAVCEILEGGERAFQERARRLRIPVQRGGTASS